MMNTSAEDSLQKGIAALEHGHTYLAMTCLEEAMESGKTPLVASALAYCLAVNRTDMERGVSLAREALRNGGGSADVSLYAGKALILAGLKDEAISALRGGLAKGRDNRLVAELDGLGSRRPPLFPALPRGHFLNRLAGLILSRLGLR